MEMFLTKDEYNRYIPTYNSDYEISKGIPIGETIKAIIKLPRNAKFHRKFIVLMKTIHFHLPEELAKRYLTWQSLLVAVKILTGHYEAYLMPNGDIIKVPKSISFGALDELEFKQFYNDALDCCLKYFIPDLTQEDIEKEFLNFM